MWLMEFYSAVEQNKVWIFTDKWRKLEIVLLSSIIQTQKDKTVYSLSYIDLSFQCIHMSMNVSVMGIDHNTRKNIMTWEEMGNEEVKRATDHTRL